MDNPSQDFPEYLIKVTPQVRLPENK